MGLADVIGIIVGIATIYFLWKANQLSREQNQIFREQNAIFAKQEEGATMAMAPPSPITGLKRYWPMVAMAALAMVTWLAVGYDIYDRHHTGAKVACAPVKANGWGTNGCTETVDGSRIMEWADRFNIALVCGVTSPTVDKFEDEQISVSATYMIRAEEFVIVSPFSQKMTKAINDAAQTAPLPGTSKGSLVHLQLTFWSDAVMLPKGVNPKDIRKLSDVARYGGQDLTLGCPSLK